jgi:hypothetical protein
MEQNGGQVMYKSESKAIPVTGLSGLKGCGMLRIPHCLASWLTNGGKVVSPILRPRSNLQKRYFSASGTHFRLRLSEPQGILRLEGLGKSKKNSHRN